MGKPPETNIGMMKTKGQSTHKNVWNCSLSQKGLPCLYNAHQGRGNTLECVNRPAPLGLGGTRF